MKINKKKLRKLIREEIKRLSYASKEQGFSYGKDHLGDEFDKEAKDDIVGHTWLSHVRKKGSSIKEVGQVIWHSLSENGEVKLYDIYWPSSGIIEENIPSELLINEGEVNYHKH